jgi:hypothetical protein
MISSALLIFAGVFVVSFQKKNNAKHVPPEKYYH